MKNIYWKIILNEMGFNEKHYNKLLSYIETHTNYENNIYLSTIKNPIGGTTLPLALKTLSKLDNFDNINFINTFSKKINNKNYQTGTYRLNMNYEDIDLKQIPDLEMFLSSDFCEKSIEFFNKKENNMYIYILFSEITQDNKIFNISHRYFEIGK